MSYTQRVGSGFQLWRREFADGVCGKDEGLVEIAPRNLDAGVDNDSAGGILDGSGEGLCEGERGA